MAHDTDAITVQDEPVLSVERLRTLVQDAHLSFLLGAGAASPYFALLGGVEDALTELERSDVPGADRAVARASVQAYFFESVLERNVGLVDGDPGAKALLDSYGRFGRTLNRILLARRSTLLDKRVNVFTTNVDLGLEVASLRTRSPTCGRPLASLTRRGSQPTSPWNTAASTSPSSCMNTSCSPNLFSKYPR